MLPVATGVRLKPTYKPQAPLPAMRTVLSRTAKQGTVGRCGSHPVPWGMILDNPVLYAELQSLL